MRNYQIALCPGDGVGAEVVAAARAVLEAVASKERELSFTFKEYAVGKSAYDATGNPLSQEALDGMRQAAGTLMGAMATGLVPPPSPMGVLRKAFDLYADVRPIRSFPGVWCLRDNIDILMIRENTEGFLADRNLHQGYGEFMPSPDLVMSLRVISRRNSERIARFTFAYARKLGRKKVTLAHKANVLRLGCGFFLEVCREVAKGYPEITVEDQYVDTVANNLIARPDSYDVVLTTNLFGDVISDEAAALVSSLVPTANFGQDCALFRPVHEAMLNIAGKGVVNPVPTILCDVMLLEWLKEGKAARLVEQAIRRVLAEGKVLPEDLGGKASTQQVTAAICQAVREA